MKKTNPLFVDSTKFQGDIIPCRIELSRVFLYPDEVMILRITDRKGNEDDSIMQAEDGALVTRVRLRHQEELEFQFFVRHKEQILFASEKKRFLGTYLFSESWEPMPEQAASLSVSPKIKAPPQAQRPLAKRNNYDGNLLSSLINKWGF